MRLGASLLVIPSLASVALAAIGQAPCVSFSASSGSFPIVASGKAAPIITDPSDSPSVHRAVGDFVHDILAVTSTTPKAVNYTSAASIPKGSSPIIVGTIDTPLIKSIVATAKLNVTGITGQWESFVAQQVSNPIAGVSKAYVIIGSDRRGVIYGLYELSEQSGVSPWYWWADVPIQKHSSVYALQCQHGPPSVKFRGIFLNDEQPALQNWAQEKFTNGTGAPFNHLFYAKLFELLLRLRINYLWPAMWAGMFGVDDPLNQATAQYYGVVMGTSHQEPMMRSTPNEFNKFYPGQKWDWYSNKQNITQYFTEGAQRAKPYESLYTVGMRGSGDVPLSADTNVALLQDIIATQREILTSVFNGTDVSTIPQVWCLYKEVQNYYEQGMTVPDDVTLLWVDDNFGNIRRFPLPSERNRKGGAGVYYHIDYVGSPRDYKWIQSTQLTKMHEQMSTAYDRGADRIWILNVGDLKPSEMATEFFITYGYDTAKWNKDNINSFVTAWATREFALTTQKSALVADIVGNLTRFNARRKPELWNSTTYSLTDYREADNFIAGWKATYDASNSIYSGLSTAGKAAYFELVHHAVSASYNLAQLYVTAGKNNLFASQARISTNDLADSAEKLFEADYDLEHQYHTMLNGKWDHMMDQTHIGYYYWQQPMANTMPPVNRVHSRKEALPGPMRITIEGSHGAWPGDNPYQCDQGYNCPPPTLRTFDTYQPFKSRFIDISAGGPNSFSWTLTPSANWIVASKKSGSVTRSQPETRVEISVDWSKVSGSTAAGNVVIASKTESLQIFVNANKTAVPSGFHGFVEGDGAVSIEASHATSNTSVSGVAWSVLPAYGKTGDGIKPLPNTGNNNANYTVGSGPSAKYDFYTFNPVKSVTSYIGLSLNGFGNDRPLKFAVQIDDTTPQVVQYVPVVTADKTPTGWDGNDGWAANNIITNTTTHGTIGAGKHTLTLWMIEPAVVLEKFVVDTGGVRASYLGPPESIRV
ncbi:hypothetical protein FRC04_000327 [Tulasnella sp. 424]|nr:hypothetical protein FRC04_000327 [Tulasnella sp. 424]KAG8982188.1 hypothetical protein FRC05_000330 [Tulasnella sp. 425]